MPRRPEIRLTDPRLSSRGSATSGSPGERRPFLFLHLRREEGQGLAEYALILSLIAILAVAALAFFSGNLDSTISMIGTKV
jgi:Flp pilus assembly pilin Flp